MKSLKRLPDTPRPMRRGMSWRVELTLALLPTMVVLAVLGLVEAPPPGLIGNSD